LKALLQQTGINHRFIIYGKPDWYQRNNTLVSGLWSKIRFYKKQWIWDSDEEYNGK
jgi:hypothetical protein